MGFLIIVKNLKSFIFSYIAIFIILAIVWCPYNCGLLNKSILSHSGYILVNIKCLIKLPAFFGICIKTNLYL